MENSKSKHYCSVPQCHTYISKDVSLHYFPLKNEKLCKKWKDILKIGKDISKYMQVCSLHFLPTDFHHSYSLKPKKRLKMGVIPSQNLPTFKSNENSNKAKKRAESKTVDQLAKPNQ